MSSATDPLFSPSTVDSLLARWATLPPADSDAPVLGSEDVAARARTLFALTLGPYAPLMSPAHHAVYRRLLSLRDAESLRHHFFDAFDLLVRTRGAALAVLKLQELHQLLRPCTAQDEASAPALAH